MNPHAPARPIDHCRRIGHLLARMRGVSTTAAPSRSYPWRGEGRGRQQRRASKLLALGRHLFCGCHPRDGNIAELKVNWGGVGCRATRRATRVPRIRTLSKSGRTPGGDPPCAPTRKRIPRRTFASPLFALPPHIPSGVKTAGRDELTTRGLFSVPGTRIFGRCPRFANNANGGASKSARRNAGCESGYPAWKFALLGSLPGLHTLRPLLSCPQVHPPRSGYPVNRIRFPARLPCHQGYPTLHYHPEPEITLRLGLPCLLQSCTAEEVTLPEVVLLSPRSPSPSTVTLS